MRISAPELACRIEEWFQNRRHLSSLFGEAALTLAVGEKLIDEFEVSVERDFNFFFGSGPKGYFNYDLYAEKANRRLVFELKYAKGLSGRTAAIAVERVRDDIFKLGCLPPENLERYFLLAYPADCMLPTEVESFLRIEKFTIDPTQSEPVANVLTASNRLKSSIEKLNDFLHLPISRNMVLVNEVRRSIVVRIYEIR